MKSFSMILAIFLLVAPAYAQINSDLSSGNNRKQIDCTKKDELINYLRENDPTMADRQISKLLHIIPFTRIVLWVKGTENYHRDVARGKLNRITDYEIHEIMTYCD